MPRGVKSRFADWNLLKSNLDSLKVNIGHYPSYGELTQKLGQREMARAIAKYHGGFQQVWQKLGAPLKMRTGEHSLSVWKNFEGEIGDVAKSLGHFPSTKDLLKLERSDLHAAIKLHGGVAKVRQRMGFALGNRTGKQSFKIWKNFHSALLEVWAQIGHFPSWGELEALGRQDLLNGFKHHGGVIAVRKRLKAPLIVKSQEASLRIESNLRAEVRMLTKQLGHFPSRAELRALGRNDILNAVDGSGGVKSLRAKMKVPEPPSKNPLHNFQTFEAEFRKVWQVLGHFPRINELDSAGRSDLRHAVEYFGGIDELRERFSEPSKIRRGKNSFKNWPLFRKEFLEVKRQLGHFPSMVELAELKRFDLYNAVGLHGGANAVREKFRTAPLVKTGKFSLKKFENLAAQLRPIMEKERGFPNQERLSVLGRYDLLHAVQLHGGLEKVRKLMGFKPSRNVGDDSFRHWKNVKPHLEMLSKELGRFPTATDLRRKKLYSLKESIRQYHGGMSNVASRLSQERIVEEQAARDRIITPESLLANPNRAPAELKPIVMEIIRQRNALRMLPSGIDEARRVADNIRALKATLANNLGLLKSGRR